MNRILCILIVFVLTVNLYSQEDPAISELVKAEIQLQGMFDKLYSEEIFGDQLELSKKTDSVFYAALQLPGAFEFNWDKLDKTGRLKSKDEKIKIISWLYMENRNHYHYFSYLLINSKKEEYEVFRFQPASGPEVKKEDFDQSVDHWHSKIYYNIITTEYKRKTYYTLLGMDFNNTMSSMKTIEVLTLHRGEPIFKKENFLIGGTVKDRLILEYSADLACSVRYDDRLNMIVFDHLAPFHPIYKSSYEFYGPDGSYDGLLFIDGIWVLQEDVDARND